MHMAWRGAKLEDLLTSTADTVNVHGTKGNTLIHNRLPLAKQGLAWYASIYVGL